MATIRKRGSSWHVQVRRTGQPSIMRSFRLKGDADAWERQMEALADREMLPINAALLRQNTVSYLLIRYRDEVVSRKKSRAQEASIIAQFLKDPLASISLGKATPSVFAQFRDKRLKVVKPATVVRQISLLQHAFNVAKIEWEWPILKNPVAEIRKPKICNRRERRLSKNELARLMSGCSVSRTPWLKPVIVFAIETGMRRSEIVSLRWAYIDFDEHSARLRETKNGHPRTVPLTPLAIDLLKRLPRKDKRVFPTTGNAIRLAWERLKKRSDIRDLRFHDLRHEAISRFFERGLSLPEVALISGHKDHRMLLRYTQLKPAEVSKKLRNTPPVASTPYKYFQVPDRYIRLRENVMNKIRKQGRKMIRSSLNPPNGSNELLNVYAQGVGRKLLERFGVPMTRSVFPLISEYYYCGLSEQECSEILKDGFKLRETGVPVANDP